VFGRSLANPIVLVTVSALKSCTVSNERLYLL
jgi:hypothetical protein